MVYFIVSHHCSGVDFNSDKVRPFKNTNSKNWLGSPCRLNLPFSRLSLSMLDREFNANSESIL